MIEFDHEETSSGYNDKDTGQENGKFRVPLETFPYDVNIVHSARNIIEPS